MYIFKYKFSKNIEKPPYRRVAPKWYNFAQGAANHCFFLLTLYLFAKEHDNSLHEKQG